LKSHYITAINKIKECEDKGISAVYIGETGRILKERLNEHFTLLKNRTRLTEVGKHCIDYHQKIDRQKWRVESLGKESDDFRRKVMEAYWIDKLKPRPNANKGITVLGIEDLKLNRFKT
jgi:hypothetical protein